MIKKLFFTSFTIFLISISCSPRIIRNWKEGERSDFGIASPSKAAFFVENETIQAEEELVERHTETANQIYGLFGSATDRMLVGRTNAKTFKFTKGKRTWFVDVGQMNKRTAMILFDGSQKPMVEYDVERYLPLVKLYLSNDLEKAQKVNTTVRKEENATRSVLDSIWSIAYKPDQKYAEKLLKNLKRNFSPAVFGLSAINCDGTIETKAFTDLAEKQLSYSSSVTYKNGQIISSEYERNREISGQNYHFNALGLVDSTVFHLNYKKDYETQFKYLADRIVTRFYNSRSRDEYLLNDKFEISKKISFDDRNNPTSEQHFYYDDLGRLIQEEYFSSRKKLSTNFFEYENRAQIRFSKMKLVPADESYISENTSTIVDGKETFINKVNGKVQSKTVSYLNKNCEGKALIYDGNGAITGVTIQRKK